MVIAIIIACAVLLVDQLSKILIEVWSPNNVVIIPGFINFDKVYNTGAAFSWLDDNTLMLACISLIATVAFSFLVYKTCNYKTKKVYTIAMAFMLGGTAGNLIDRFLAVFNVRDGVVDFFDMELFGWQFPGIFNVADIFLCVGVGMLVVDMLFLQDKRSNKVKEVTSAESEVIENEDIQD